MAPEKQPFTRRPIDPALTLAAIEVDTSGTLVGPNQIGVWERIFSDDSARTAGASDPRHAQPQSDGG